MAHAETIVSLCLFLAWILINVADVAWIYNYESGCIYPDPLNTDGIYFRCAADTRWLALLSGFLLFGINGLVFGHFLDQSECESSHLFIVGPFAVVMTLGPFFAPFLMLPNPQKATWDHGCDNYPIQVLLSAKAYHDPFYQPNTASYFQGNKSLYTYDIFQTSADIWSFDIRTIDSPDLEQNQSAALYPSISKITYNFMDRTFSADCTSPPPNTTSTCIEGSFDLYNYLSFKLTDLQSNSTTSIQAVNKQWTFRDDAPSVLLQDNNGAQVLRTAVTKSGDCTQLKVCVAHDNGASITVPMGLILIRQMDYAIYCTTPQPTTIIITMPPSPTAHK